MSLKYTIGLFDKKQHDVENFHCGVKELDVYLKERAGQEVKKKVAAVYVIQEHDSRNLIGYYTLSAYSIELTNLSEDIAKKFPKYPLLPATLLGRLAVDKESQGRGIGEMILLDALARSYGLSKQIGSMAVVVDAKNETIQRFYERYGFTRFLAHPRKLYLLMGTIKVLLIA